MMAGAEPQDDELEPLLEAIYRRFHHDFRGYARASLRRRVDDACAHLGCATIGELHRALLRDAEVFTRVLQFLTIKVSDMFRDPSFFLSLRQEVAPHLRTWPSIRVWAAGCSSGEEIYSLAIVLHETGLLKRATLYATDINEESLRKAEAGIYAADRVAQFSRNYLAAGGEGSLSDYYTASHGSAIFDRSLKANVIFADHSLATDGAFCEAQLVLCRNVLIYFQRELQDRAVGLFRESLCRGGFLGLGAKETLSFSSEAPVFCEFNRGDRIYRKGG